MWKATFRARCLKWFEVNLLAVVIGHESAAPRTQESYTQVRERAAQIRKAADSAASLTRQLPEAKVELLAARKQPPAIDESP